MRLAEVAGRPDFSALVDLIRAEWPSQWGPISDEGMVAEMDKSCDPEMDLVKLLVDEEGRTRGFSRWSRWPRDPSNRDEAHTLDIAVAAECRGMGYGRLLFADMIAEARASGFKRLRSRTFEDNVASNGLHVALGFREDFRVPPKAGEPSGAESIVWILDLV